MGRIGEGLTTKQEVLQDCLEHMKQVRVFRVAFLKA